MLRGYKATSCDRTQLLLDRMRKKKWLVLTYNYAALHVNVHAYVCAPLLCIICVCVCVCVCVSEQASGRIPVHVFLGLAV